MPYSAAISWRDARPMHSAMVATARLIGSVR